MEGENTPPRFYCGGTRFLITKFVFYTKTYKFA